MILNLSLIYWAVAFFFVIYCGDIYKPTNVLQWGILLTLCCVWPGMLVLIYLHHRQMRAEDDED